MAVEEVFEDVHCVIQGVDALLRIGVQDELWVTAVVTKRVVPNLVGAMVICGDRHSLIPQLC